MKLQEQTEKYARAHHRCRTWKRVVGALACAVVFCTTYALILPAITMEETPKCGKEEHTHSDVCYAQVLPGAQTEPNDGNGELTCKLEEHTHSLACFSDPSADVETAEDWEQTFAEVRLTGVLTADVLAIAESQLDYTESAANYVVAEDGVTKKGYTRYGAWYGEAYAYEDWAAMFVSFCLNYAGVPKEAFPQNASCPQWIESLQNEDLYAPAGEEYQPSAGDLVFFDCDGDGVSDHVGLVRKLRYDEETGTVLSGFSAIEGDCEDKVAEKDYRAEDASIMGYGVLSALDGAAPIAQGDTWDYNEDGSIWWTDTSGRQTANRVEAIAATNTVINLFDYWIAPNRTEPDNVKPSISGQLNTGINKDHTLKFSHGDENPKLNDWTGGRQLPRQGMVAKLLDDSGYPVLSGDEEVNGTAATDPLNYLFDPNMECEGKVSYRNVGGLLTIDREGYHSFDCNETMAEFNEDSNSIYVYNKPGVGGQFFPFNQAPEIMTAKHGDAVINHYFGLTLTTRFIQQYGGYTDEKRTKNTTFHFSGDDDVWIFIDGVLVGDVGGIHDASSVDIDFVTGEVVVSVTADPSKEKKTTLRDCYRAAGKENDVKWNGDTNTFADKTSHVLKFYYLERGNYASNLTLKYNLTEIPKTAIYKVDQYGDTVPGATFAVYAADDKYRMLDAKGGSGVTVENPQYDESGNIVDGGGKLLVNALYTGTTNEQGEMLFADSDGMPYSIKELEELFGLNFILREIKVPEGYRVVSKDAHLEIWHGETQTVLMCNNTTESGSRAASTLQITATDKLHLHKEYDGKKSVQYIDANGDVKGTLFAVVFKYTGPKDKDGNAELKDVNNSNYWTPVYGSDKDGYTIVPLTTGADPTDAVNAALKAAKAAAEGYGENSVVFAPSTSGTMQLTMENLPGRITSYYRMLAADQKAQARYTVGYYWTDQDSLADATSENTYRVFTFAGEGPVDSQYSGFERVFGANIQVPNLINKVFVQKVDETDTLINGATFGIYRVQQDETTGEIQYLAEDGSYVPLSADAKVGEDGVITDGAVTIRPLETKVTKAYTDGIHTGTAEFSNLEDGQYIIKEVKAPPGYHLNTADVMVLITEDTIYANAGREDDGVSVGRGPGYVADTMSQFASEGQINNTLTWIYAQMQISKPSTSFADVGDTSKIVGYLTKDKSSQTSPNQTDAATTYLRFESVAGGAAFNYVENEERSKEASAQNPIASRRLFTTVGWPYYEIYQDYDYGSGKRRYTADYQDLRGRDLAKLFSRSTYIRIRDTQETAMVVKKVDSSSPGVVIKDAQFRMYRLAADNTTKEYYARNAADEVSWTKDAKDALVVTTGDDGLSTVIFTKLTDGVYYLEEVKAPNGYQLPSEPVVVTINQAQATLTRPSPPHGHKVEGVLNNNLYTYTVTVPNSTGFELPKTGGHGAISYIMGGVLLMISAGILLLYIKYKRRKKDFASS